MFSKAVGYLPPLATLVNAVFKPLPPDQAAGQTTNVTIESSGINRTYLVSIPPSYDCETLTPVIFSFHGANRNAIQQQELSQFSNAKFNDLQFVTDMIDQFEELYAVDSARIWASGKSDGGGFTNLLACDPILSTRIAAFAPVSGAFYVDNVTIPCDPANFTITCRPGRAKIPILEFHGYKDHTIDYFGHSSRKKGACLPSIPYWAQEWALRDGLSTTNVTSNLTNTTDTVVYTFGTGEETGLVTQVTDFKLAHDWPSLDPVGDSETADFDATPMILDFFKRYPLF